MKTCAANRMGGRAGVRKTTVDEHERVNRRVAREKVVVEEKSLQGQARPCQPKLALGRTPGACLSRLREGSSGPYTKELPACRTSNVINGGIVDVVTSRKSH